MKSQYRLLERPKLLSTFSDTSVEDHESEECDTRLATLERDFPQLQEEFLQTKATLAKHMEDLKILLLRTRPQRLVLSVEDILHLTPCQSLGLMIVQKYHPLLIALIRHMTS